MILQGRIQLAVLQRLFAFRREPADSQRAAALRESLLQHDELTHHSARQLFQVFELKHESVDEMSRRDRPQLFGKLWNRRVRRLARAQLDE